MRLSLELFSRSGAKAPRRATQNVRSLAPLPQMEGEPGNWRGRGGKGGVFWEKMIFLGGVPQEKIMIGVM